MGDHCGSLCCIVSEEAYTHHYICMPMSLCICTQYFLIAYEHNISYKPACARSRDSVQPALFSLCCPSEDVLDPYLLTECSTKTLIRLCGRTGLYEFSLSAQAVLEMLRPGLYSANRNAQDCLHFFNGFSDVCSF